MGSGDRSASGFHRALTTTTGYDKLTVVSTDTRTPALIVTRMTAHLAQKSVTDPMGTLAANVAGARDADDAMRHVQNAAETEVATRQWTHVAMIIDGGQSPVDALRLVVDETTRQIVGQGADDTRSGRANDLRRTRFDALRRWVQDASCLLCEG